METETLQTPRLVIPRSMKEEILYTNHNIPTAGHLGVKRTYSRIATNYYWKGMWRDTQRWVQSCPNCQMRKGNPKKNIGIAFSVPTSTPFEVVGIDLLGPFNQTLKGNRHILVFTDHFTKWVEAVAIKRQDAKTIAKHFVEEIICRHGAPAKILTDRGRALLSETLQYINQDLQIQHLKTSGYHPQTNGVTERFNKTIIEMASMFVASDQKDWDIYIPYLLFAYRTTVHSSTKETPFFLVYGRNPRNIENPLNNRGN